jgi:hypothetical protein
MVPTVDPTSNISVSSRDLWAKSALRALTKSCSCARMGLERVQIAAPLGKRWRTIPQTRGAPLGNVAVRALSLSVGGAAFMVDSLDVKGGRTIMLV